MVIEIKQGYQAFFFVNLIYQDKWATYMNSSFLLQRASERLEAVRVLKDVLYLSIN